ncbi:hypothetical protein Tco_0128956 [Tanacetum coccineum]
MATKKPPPTLLSLWKITAAASVLPENLDVATAKDFVLPEYVRCAGGLERVLKDFLRMLDNKIEKIVLFLLEQQGMLASRLDALGKEQDALQEEPDFAKISAL